MTLSTPLSIVWDLLWSSHAPNLKSSTPLDTKIKHHMKSIKSATHFSVNNLPKYTIPHLTPLSLLVTLTSYWRERHFLWPDLISPKSCYYYIRELRCTIHTLIAFTIATSTVHSKLDYCNSITTCPSLRSPSSNRSRTLLHVLLTKLPNPVTSHSHPTVSALVKDNQAHWIQAPVTYLQSSHNHPTFISA